MLFGRKQDESVEEMEPEREFDRDLIKSGMMLDLRDQADRVFYEVIEPKARRVKISRLD